MVLCFYCRFQMLLTEWLREMGSSWKESVPSYLPVTAGSAAQDILQTMSEELNLLPTQRPPGLAKQLHQDATPTMSKELNLCGTPPQTMLEDLNLLPTQRPPGLLKQLAKAASQTMPEELNQCGSVSPTHVHHVASRPPGLSDARNSLRFVKRSSRQILVKSLCTMN